MKRNAISNLALKLRHEARRKQLSATCIHCNGDVLNTLCKAADDWAGYGPPASRIFECPHCEREVEFELWWETVLCRAMPIVEEPEP